MPISAAEILLLVAFGYGIYRLLRPLQRRIERTVYRILKGHSGSNGSVIEVKDFRRKD